MTEKIKSNCIVPSCAFSVPPSLIKRFDPVLKKGPAVGDLVFGEILELGHHMIVESRSVRAARITGTASLKDILLMSDCGAEHIADFTYFGHPSTYLIEPTQLIRMFHDFDMKYGNNPRNYLVVEFANGIFQRETALLLKMLEVRNRIHRLIFCAPDSTAVIGGLRVLKDEFDLEPKAISRLCSSLPLAIREIRSFCDLPVLESMEKDYRRIFDIIG